MTTPATPATLALVAAVVVVLNVPFGWWRAGTRKLSLSWFLAVHAPVPLVVATRLAAGVRWQLATLPLLVAAYACGQFVGGWLRARRERATAGSDAREPPC